MSYTKRQGARMMMYHTIISYMNGCADLIATMPALQSAYTEFKNGVAAIEEISMHKARKITGITQQKTQFRKALSVLAASIASSLYAYASSIDNNVLKEQVNFSASDLLRFKDEDLLGACANIITAVGENIVAMADYNITQLTVDNFAILIKDYAGKVPQPRNALNQRAGYSVSMKELFKVTDHILKTKMDKMLSAFKKANPEFYALYKGNRLIVDPRTTHTQIKGTITNHSTSEPLTGATISIFENEMVAHTNNDGKYIIKPIGHGTYTINITKEGFKPQTLTGQLVKLGQITTINVEMVPAI